MNRDKNLDYYRGFALIWVILIHTIYWTGFLGENIFRSYLLFEMPLFFFVAGASNAMSKKKTLDFYKARAKRILIPYWVYAFIAATITHSTVTFLGLQDELTQQKVSNILSFYLNWTTSFDVHSNLIFLKNHLWFPLVYLMIMLAFPVLRWARDKVNIAPLIVLPLVLYIIDQTTMHWQLSYWLHNLIFYSIWTFLGLYYEQMKEKPIKIPYRLLLSVIAWGITYLLIQYKDYSIDMQYNKFPPNTAFLFMSIGTFSLLTILKDLLLWSAKLLPVEKLLITYSNYGYSIYLYHPFAFLFLGNIFVTTGKLPFLFEHPIVGVISYFILALLICIPLGKTLGKIEKL